MIFFNQIISYRNCVYHASSYQRDNFCRTKSAKHQTTMNGRANIAGYVYSHFVAEYSSAHIFQTMRLFRKASIKCIYPRCDKLEIKYVKRLGISFGSISWEQLPKRRLWCRVVRIDIFDEVGRMNSEPKNDVGKGKMPMSDEERRELAEKLDQELDEFIGGLEKRSSTYEWPEDRWQEVRCYINKLKFMH